MLVQDIRIETNTFQTASLGGCNPIVTCSRRCYWVQANVISCAIDHPQVLCVYSRLAWMVAHTQQSPYTEEPELLRYSRALFGDVDDETGCNRALAFFERIQQWWCYGQQKMGDYTKYCRGA